MTTEKKNYQLKILLQELQLSTSIILFLSILLVFTSYGVILRKFYNRRKKVEGLKNGSQGNKEFIQTLDSFNSFSNSF